MNEQQAIAKFVETNFRRLTADEFSQKQLRNLLRQFFTDQHRNKFGRPSPREVIGALHQLMVRRGIHPDKIARYVSELPVFNLAGDALRDELLASMSSGIQDTAIMPEDLETIKQVGAFEAVRQSKGREIEEEQRQKLDDLTSLIAQKQDEYVNLPSILDEEAVAEPTYDPELEDVKPWWERFYLRGNPFPRKDGLSDIRKELYEGVLVKTAPFENTLSALRRDPDYLYHTGFLLVGDYQLLRFCRRG